MKRFAKLYTSLDGTNKTNDKVAALADYFTEAPPADAAWAIYLLSGNKPRQIIPIRRLCEWACESAGIDPWLFEECYEAVGDLAETINLVLPDASAKTEGSLANWIDQRVLPLRDADEQSQQQAMFNWWESVSPAERFVLLKLITGAFRVGVSQRLVIRALTQATGIASDSLSDRLMGDWTPSAEFYERVVDASADDGEVGRPFPFFLAHPLEAPPEELGEMEDWQAEWKWDGIRAQMIRRGGEIFIWSRGEELMTDRFPEIEAAAECLPDGTVIDGEILAWKDGVLPFAVMQKRIGRKKLGKRILAEAPVILMAFDLLEAGGVDIRQLPLSQRRSQLEALLAPLPPSDRGDSHSLMLSPTLDESSWKALATLRQASRQQHAEGLMLKRRDSAYGVGRPRGDWWKWKIEPYTIDAVLIYAQRGSGRRASLYTDYTFAVWKDDELVPFAKAYSGLTHEEIAEVDAFVRRETQERFGPVRSVTPELVFEIAFENLQPSKRHKSGVAVRFPRIKRWRRDKTPQQADTMESLMSLIEP